MRDRGVSIIELMVVLVIIGIMAAFTAPNLTRWSTSIRMNSSVKEITSELQLARVKAIAQNTDVTLCFYGPSTDFPQYPNGFFSSHLYRDGIWCPDPPAASDTDFERFKPTVRGLPAGVTVTPPAGSRITFKSTGQVRGISARIDLTNLGTQTAKRIIVHTTGRVRICVPGEPNCTA